MKTSSHNWNGLGMNDQELLTTRSLLGLSPGQNRVAFRSHHRGKNPAGSPKEPATTRWRVLRLRLIRKNPLEAADSVLLPATTRQRRTEQIPLPAVKKQNITTRGEINDLRLRLRLRLRVYLRLRSDIQLGFGSVPVSHLRPVAASVIMLGFVFISRTRSEQI
jgi:hypothetical protein